jgi:hypothetical protein
MRASPLQLIKGIDQDYVHESEQLQQSMVMKIVRENNGGTTINLLMIVVMFSVQVKCKDTCTCSPQKSLLSLDGLNNQSDWFFTTQNA